MMDVDPVEVQNLSKNYRASVGITQRQLAQKVKTTPGLIGEIEKGVCRSTRVAKEIRALALAQAAEV